MAVVAVVVAVGVAVVVADVVADVAGDVADDAGREAVPAEDLVWWPPPQPTRSAVTASAATEVALSPLPTSGASLVQDGEPLQDFVG